MVELGQELPSWELTRWGRDTLRFCPVPRDRYAIRGTPRQLLYRGERESHCFTILDNRHFEYDIILKRKPERNTIVLFLEGWENFDFFRQPDRFGPEALRGSYAVYKKEFVLNSVKYHVGTGKFCHIHRPKIIDRRGREVWGDLRIDRGVMTIRIPEDWLGEAAYPVVVDPVIGSNTIGAYRTFPYIDEDDYTYYLRDLTYHPEEADLMDYCVDEEIYLEELIALNRQTTPLKLQGTYNAYLYSDKTDSYTYGSTTYYVDDIIAYPMLYNSVNDKPKQTLFSGTAPVPVLVSPASPPKWNKGTLTFGTAINSGTDIWFGFGAVTGIVCRFDYGSQYWGVHRLVYPEDWRLDGYGSLMEGLEDYGLTDVSKGYAKLSNSGKDGVNIYPGARSDFKISMYLELPAQQYTRTVTQGVRLTDNRKRVHGIVKKLLQTAGIHQTNNRIQHAIRKREETAAATEGHSRTHTAVRQAIQTTGIHDIPIHEKGLYRIMESLLGVVETIGPVRSIVRALYATVTSVMEVPVRRDIRLGVSDSVNHGDSVNRSRGFFAFLRSGLGSHDHTGYTGAWGRTVPDPAYASGATRRSADYRRNPRDDLSGTGESLRRAEYIRVARDQGNVHGEVRRMLSVFIRLVSFGAARDYIIRRFLKSNEEIVIKSAVCRDITLDSTLH
jgi:hypothetical protein